MEFIKFIVCLLFCGLVSSKLHAQNKNQFGITIAAENYSKGSTVLNLSTTKYYQPKFYPSIGVVFERIITKTSSITASIQYRQLNSDVRKNIPQTAGFPFIEHSLSERYLSVPLTYKIKTKILSISAGFVTDFLVSWKELENDRSFGPFPEYDQISEKKIQAGFFTSLSRKIEINKSFIVEPQLFYSPLLTANRSYFGLGIQLKYRL
jgi:hypothetical protein